MSQQKVSFEDNHSEVKNALEKIDSLLQKDTKILSSRLRMGTLSNQYSSSTAKLKISVLEKEDSCDNILPLIKDIVSPTRPKSLKDKRGKIDSINGTTTPAGGGAIDILLASSKDSYNKKTNNVNKRITLDEHGQFIPIEVLHKRTEAALKIQSLYRIHQRKVALQLYGRSFNSELTSKRRGRSNATPQYFAVVIQTWWRGILAKRQVAAMEAARRSHSINRRISEAGYMKHRGGYAQTSFRDVFFYLDPGCDGRIDAKDVRMTSRDHGYILTKQDAQEIIWQVSDSMQGSLCFSEFQNMCTNCQKDSTGHEPRHLYSIAEFLKHTDLGRQVLPLHKAVEYIRKGQSSTMKPKEVLGLFHNLNKPGFVSLQEFCKATLELQRNLATRQKVTYIAPTPVSRYRNSMNRRILQDRKKNSNFVDTCC